MFKRFVVLTTVATLVLSVFAVDAFAKKDGSLDRDRWQNKAGWSMTDSLSWRWSNDTLRVGQCVDTLTAGGADTSAWVNIEGVEAITLTSLQNYVAAGGGIVYTVQVSDDRVAAKNLATTFSTASSAATTTTVAERFVVYAANVDSSVSGGALFAGQRAEIGASTYMRVIATLRAFVGTDSTFHSAVVKRRWPLDPK